MTAKLVFYQWLAQGTIALFIFALGACAGSFLNVVAYRLPRGLNIVSPPSACPSCSARLGWRENFPIFGWLLLRGKCRHCAARISPQYVLMELVVATLFLLLWALWGIDTRALASIGIELGAWRPEWAQTAMTLMWPMFALGIILVGSLVVSTLIDAQTFTIPAIIPWIVMGVALVVHPVHAHFVAQAGGLQSSPFAWTIPAPDGGMGWIFIHSALAGLIGLLIANVLLALRVIPRSFSDFDEWERQAEAAMEEAKRKAQSSGEALAEPEAESISRLFVRTLILTGPAVAGMFAGTLALAPHGRSGLGLAVGGGVGLVFGAILRGLAVRGGDEPNPSDPVWTQYPHARREMLKECLFLLPVVALIAIGLRLGVTAGQLAQDATTGEIVSTAAPPPLWLLALGASAMGALVGGGLVWGVRILGSLAFGKEAMGLGDVHLMAGVGAVLGWIDPLVAFFVAPFFGIAWALLGPVLGKIVKLPSVLPYGPHLALATVLVMYAKPLSEGLLSMVFRTPVNLP